MYFNGVPLTNQFLCRANLCQAQLLSPKSNDDVVRMMKLKAIAQSNFFNVLLKNLGILYLLPTVVRQMILIIS